MCQGSLFASHSRLAWSEMVVSRLARTLVTKLDPRQLALPRRLKGPVQRPRLGLAGSFCRGNYGDELYVLNYQHWFGSWADLFLLTRLRKPPYFRDIGSGSVDDMDAVVLGGGDLLCPYREKIDRDFVNSDYLRKPLHVAGIGVELNRSDIDPTVLARWKEFLCDPAVASITTRDPGSAAWIEQHIAPRHRVGSHPDMVCALPLPPATRPDGPPILGLVTRHIKHPKEYVLAAEAARVLASRGWRVRHVIGGVGRHGAKDLENSRHLEAPGKETFHSENLDDISRALGECSLVLSMKLHTTLVSVMYEVPTICLNPVVKARAFMQAAGCGDLVLAHNDRRLLSLIDEGVPPPPSAHVAKLRQDAGTAMVELGQRIWDDFRNGSDARRKALPAKVPVPDSPA